MKGYPLESVSIIIVNHNGERHLKDCLGSLHALDYPPGKFEVILFDNGSTDDSVEAAKSIMPSVRIIEHPTNIGFSSPHRRAVAEANYGILAFLNNDMKVHRDWLREGVSSIDLQKGIVCASSKILSWDGRKTSFAGGTLQYLGYAEQMVREDGCQGEEILFPCGGSMFVSKGAFIEAGCFDDDYFAIFEDVDFGWRLWIMGYRVILASRSIAYHREHATLDTRGVEKKRYLMHRNALATIIKNYDDNNLRRILPMACVLAIKRALLASEVKKSDFYFWNEHERKKRKVGNGKIEGYVQLAALDDVFGSFERLMDKRRAVQGARKRADAEIFPLFRDPFRDVMGGREEYLWQEVSMFEALGLVEVFGCGEEYERRLQRAVSSSRGVLRGLTEEIRKKTFVMGGRSKGGAGRLVERCIMDIRENGFCAAMKKVGMYVADWFDSHVRR